MASPRCTRAGVSRPPCAVLQDEHRALYVASRSKWAPQCIGPYCQAVSVQQCTFGAGQIGLDPFSMQLVAGGLPAQMRQAVQSAARVLQAASPVRDEASALFTAWLPEAEYLRMAQATRTCAQEVEAGLRDILRQDEAGCSLDGSDSESHGSCAPDSSEAAPDFAHMQALPGWPVLALACQALPRAALFECVCHAARVAHARATDSSHHLGSVQLPDMRQEWSFTAVAGAAGQPLAAAAHALQQGLAPACSVQVYGRCAEEAASLQAAAHAAGAAYAFTPVQHWSFGRCSSDQAALLVVVARALA